MEQPRAHRAEEPGRDQPVTAGADHDEIGPGLRLGERLAWPLQHDRPFGSALGVDHIELAARRQRRVLGDSTDRGAADLCAIVVTVDGDRDLLRGAVFGGDRERGGELARGCQFLHHCVAVV